jgi:hypothetical protein
MTESAHSRPIDRDVEVRGHRYYLRATPEGDHWFATVVGYVPGPSADPLAGFRSSPLNIDEGAWSERGTDAVGALAALEDRIRVAITAAVAARHADPRGEPPSA